MTPWVALSATAGVVLSAGAILAASFDCNVASNRAEHLICQQAELSGLDDKMVGLFERWLAISNDPAGARREHARWIASRNQCGTAECLRSTYKIRIDELNRLIAAVPSGESRP